MNYTIKLIDYNINEDIINHRLNICDKDFTTIIFANRFNNPINNVDFPNQIKKIVFGKLFNQVLDKIKFPNDLEELYFGDNFNQEIFLVKFPENIKVIRFGYNFNQLVDNIIFPESLEILEFGYEFNQSLKNIQINSNSKIILNGISLKSLENLPNNLKYLEIYNIKEPLKNLPITLEKIFCKYCTNNILEKSKIPFNCSLVINKIE